MHPRPNTTNTFKMIRPRLELETFSGPKTVVVLD